MTSGTEIAGERSWILYQRFPRAARVNLDPLRADSSTCRGEKSRDQYQNEIIAPILTFFGDVLISLSKACMLRSSMMPRKGTYLRMAKSGEKGARF